MFGDMPLPAKFFIAFVIVLALIGGVAWLVRRFGTGGLGASSARGRQARLGVIEAAAVDSRRRLVLVRRDNVEHLIMLGGPTDLVVEANIVRAQAAATREVLAQRPAEAPGWPPPVDDGMWPAAPEPAFRAGRGPERPAVPPPVADELPLQPHPEPAPRVQAGDRLSGLAAEIARSGSRGEAPIPRAMAEPPRSPTEPRRPLAAPPRVSEEAHASDRHLAAMAQQLEAALRRPGQTAHGREGASAEPPAARRFGGESRPIAEPREPRSSLLERAMQSRSSASLTPSRTKVGDTPPVHADAAENAATASTGAPESAPPPPPNAATPAEPTGEASQPSDGPAEANEAAASKPSSIEEEMANLLGRSPGKT
jgi:flagellar protein FliO/FliZ